MSRVLPPRRPVVCLSLAFLLAACGGSPAGVSRAEADSLRAIIETLTKEVDDLKHGAPRLLGEARTAFASQRWDEVKRAATMLEERHPQALETDSAQALVERAVNAERAAQAAADREAERVRREEAARLANALKGLTKKRDDIKNVTYYRDATSPQFVDSRSNISLAIIDPDDRDPYLALYIYYVADDWLFIENYTVKAGAETFQIDASGFDDVKRDNNYGGIFEWYTALAESHLPMIRAIIAAPSATLRYQGRQYYKDRTITASEKRALQHMLDAHAALLKRG